MAVHVEMELQCHVYAACNLTWYYEVDRCVRFVWYSDRHCTEWPSSVLHDYDSFN